ncbi:hypothetical protein A8H39_06615 [Paraburkholderia fungorum]|uniref:hypothetical protein n=1 Tax=Paraburkholderia fungorum TaxID=134537 RepID=UPI000480EA4F|nr:hypothetical protein [Paraburkholderia fungorum]MBB5546992.1 hypothetical protein [Paraburkholderia fungorum]PNE55547.1 hypothetical protein A8H39_06615 [Paraburkholderia fungorum]
MFDDEKDESVEYWSQQFELLKVDPRVWAADSDSLMRSFNILAEQHTRDLGDNIRRAVKSAGAPVPRIPEIGANAMMLGALATEVLFKGIALSRKEVQESLESEDKAIAKRLWSHRLSDIAVLAGVELTGDEATLCEQLEIFATWAGRYSTPKLVKDMMPLRRSPWTGQAMLPNTYSNVDFMRIRNLNARYRSRLPEMPEVQLGLASGR